MNKTLGFLLVGVIAFFAGLVVYDVWFADEDPAPGVACPPRVTDRYTEDELHSAYRMTREMSRDDASPMWHDPQLEQSLTDPVFVAELEAHFCRMQEMVAER